MRVALVLIGVMTVIVASTTRPAGVQSAAQTSAVPSVGHIGVVVRNIDRAVELVASSTGADKLAVQPAERRTQVGLGRAAYLRLSNVALELLEPADDAPLTLRNFVNASSIGAHHIGLESAGGNMTDQANRLAQLGGEIITTGPDRAFVDLTSKPGPVVEILNPALRDRLYGAGLPRPRLEVASPFAQLPCLTHVGIVVRDLEQAQRTFALVVRMDPPPIQPLEAATGSARYTMFKLQNISVEFLQQTRGVSGTYADFLGTQAQRVHHIGLHLRGRNTSYRTVPEQIAWLERHGGKVGVDAERFGYVDMGLGVFIEALAEDSINRVYPCN